MAPAPMLDEDRGAMARRALLQTIAAGHRYAACPVDLGAHAGEAPHLVAQAEGRCGWWLWLEQSRTVEVCLLPAGHDPEPITPHPLPYALAEHDPACAPFDDQRPDLQLVDQVDALSRIERRAAFARAELEGQPSIVAQVLDDLTPAGPSILDEV